MDRPRRDAIGTGAGEEADAAELASPLLDLREKPPEPLAPSPQALGIWELAWPTIVASLMQTLVRWADVKMVGDLGVNAVAAVMGGGHLYWIIQSVVMAITTGLTALLARAVGAGDIRLADATLRQSVVLGTAVGGLLMLVIPFSSGAMGLYGLDDAVVAPGSVYLDWLLVGNVPFTLAFVFATGLRAAGDARTPLIVGIFANILNVFLNWVLIYGHLGAPALGVAGAGIASSLAMVFQVVVFAWMWRANRLRTPWRTGSFRPDLGLWRRITRIGYPATLEAALFSGGIFAFMRIMSEYGTAEFTAYNIGAQILALSFLPGFGFSTAASTLVGQHLGDGDPAAAARSGWRSAAGAVVSMSVIGTAVVVAAEPIAAWFVDDAAVIALTVDFIWILGLAQPLMAVEYALGGALRGAGDTRFPLFAVFLGLLVFRMGTALFLYQWLDPPIQWIWCTLLLDYGTKAILLSRRFARGRWQTIEV